jgi:hypothetical protein
MALRTFRPYLSISVGPVIRSGARIPAIVRSAVLVLLVLGGSGGVRAADDSATVGKIALLNRRAIDEYQNLNFDEAQKLLREALDLATQSGLNQHPIRARTYVTLGIVTLGGLKQRDAAVNYFRKALQIQPEIKLSRSLANPEIEGAFNEAVAGLGSAPPRELPPEKLLVHDPVRTAGQGQAITIGVTVDPDFDMRTLVLAYRAAGAASFSEIEMPRQPGGRFEAVIPATATGGAQVVYYIEARGVDGKPLAARGSAANPMVVAVAPAPVVVAVPGPIEAAPERPPVERRFLLALMVGSGLGWMNSGTAEESQASVNQGNVAWARLGHLAPEIGYFVSPRFLLAVQARLQLVGGANEFHLPGNAPSNECGGDGICSPAAGAFAAVLKGAWFFSDPKGAWRPYASLSIGGGTIRHVTTFSAIVHCGPNGDQACVDTVPEGSFLFGAGIGFDYRLSDGVGLVVAFDLLAGAPHFAINGDLNLGLSFRL